jgi:opacity protein-like surface antigen
LGLNYQINDVPNERIVREEEPRPKYPYTLQIATYGGYKDTDFMTGTGVYFVGELDFNLLKQYRPVRSWGAGFALSMDYAEMEMLKRKGEFSGSAVSYMIPSVKAIHQFHVGRLCIGTELAYMMYHKGRNKNVYANLIVGYDVNDWLTPGIVLRAGAFYADYIGIGLGCKVWKIK